MNPALEIAISFAWFALVLAAAYWMRFDAPIWGGY